MKFGDVDKEDINASVFVIDSCCAAGILNMRGRSLVVA
jgi:hypothetical protein